MSEPLSMPSPLLASIAAPTEWDMARMPAVAKIFTLHAPQRAERLLALVEQFLKDHPELSNLLADEEGQRSDDLPEINEWELSKEDWDDALNQPEVWVDLGFDPIRETMVLRIEQIEPFLHQIQDRWAEIEELATRMECDNTTNNDNLDEDDPVTNKLLEEILERVSRTDAVLGDGEKPGLVKEVHNLQVAILGDRNTPGLVGDVRDLRIAVIGSTNLNAPGLVNEMRNLNGAIFGDQEKEKPGLAKDMSDLKKSVLGDGKNPGLSENVLNLVKVVGHNGQDGMPPTGLVNDVAEIKNIPKTKREKITLYVAILASCVAFLSMAINFYQYLHPIK